MPSVDDLLGPAPKVPSVDALLGSKPKQEAGFLSDPIGSIKRFASEFGAASEKATAVHQGQSLAQRVLDPEELRKAESVALSTGPANLTMAKAAATPSLAAANRLADFQKVGVTPNVPAVGQGRVAGLGANIGRTLPFSPIESGIRQNLGEVQAASGNLATRLGTPLSPADAGAVAKNAIQRFAEDRTQAGKDFGEFFRLMRGAPPAPVTNTVNSLQRVMGRFPSAPGLSGLFTSSPIAKLKTELQTVQALTIPELKELRSQLGYQLNHINFGPEQIPKAQLRELYGALSKDLEAAAKAQGKDALKAFRTANFNYGTRMKLIDELEPLVREGQASPESVFKKLNAAAEGGNAGLLIQVKKVLDPQEWGQVGASVVQKLGKPTPGATSLAQGTPFSIGSYVTNWSKLSDKAKDLLFGQAAPGNPREGLDALARVASDLKNVEKLANVSHSGEFVNAARVVESVFAGIAAGTFPWATAIGIGGAYGAARLMMSPKFTAWLYSVPRITARAGASQAATQAASESLRRTLLGVAPEVAGPPTVPQHPYSDTMRRAAQPVSPQP